MIDTTETAALIAADPTAVHIRRDGLDLHANPYTVRLIAYPLDEDAERQVATIIALPDTPLTAGTEARTAGGDRWRVVGAETDLARGRVEAVAVKES